MNRSNSHHESGTFAHLLYNDWISEAFCGRLIHKCADMLYTRCTSDILRLVHLGCSAVEPRRCWPVSRPVYYWPAQHNCVKCMQSGQHCTYKTFLNNRGLHHAQLVHYISKPLVHDHNYWYMLDAGQASMYAALPRQVFSKHKDSLCTPNANVEVQEGYAAIAKLDCP